ncbi:MAG: DegV family EDD domain-containing protein [Leptospiraceae bacterium]|nr:DegV family EDD domain-containing protein [Leptospiraceae bacterium]
MQIINGNDFYKACLSGLNELGRHLGHVNAINVFPVADGDTGTNMYATLQGAIIPVRPVADLSTTLQKMAEGAVLSSRGNSGAILAQNFASMAKYLKDFAEAKTSELAHAWAKGAAEAEKGLQNPIPGTILDAMKSWAQFLIKAIETEIDLPSLFRGALPVLRTAVEKTQETMPLLARSKVVDAGAEGFFHFIAGFTNYILNPSSVNLQEVSVPEEDFHLHPTEELDKIEFRYCTEAVLKTHGDVQVDLSGLMKKYGDSYARAATGSFIKFHVHTNEPEMLFQELFTMGEILNPKAEDMKAQAAVHLHRKTKTAIVVDSSCDIPAQIIEEAQIFTVPVNLMFGQSQFLDKITITTEHFYKLAEKADVYPTTSQPNASAFENTYRYLLSYYDEIVSIHISENLSGTINSARVAAQNIDAKRIKIFDSKNLSSSFGLLVYDLVKNSKPDWNASTILQYLESRVSRVKLMVAVKSMKYMMRSGRVKFAAGMIARTLNLTPIVSLDENGKSKAMGKGFSQNSNIRKIIRHCINIKETNGIRYFAVGHAHDPELAIKVADELNNKLGIECTYIMDIAPVIGLHAGKGSLSVAFMTEK